MARYQEIADDLRRRIQAGDWQVGERLPGISALQDQYNERSLNTIRNAQQVLVTEGMLRTEQGVGAFVTATQPTRAVDLPGTLAQARDLLDAALAIVGTSATTPSAPSRHEIVSAIRHPGHMIYTAQAITEAALLLDDLRAAAAQRGYTDEHFELNSLAGSALAGVIRRWSRSGPAPDSNEGGRMLAALAAALNKHGLTAEVQVEQRPGERPYPFVRVGRTAAMPALGPDNRAGIWISLTTDHIERERSYSWIAAVDLPRGGPVCDIVAPVDESGVTAVAASIAQFAAGTLGHNPFNMW